MIELAACEIHPPDRWAFRSLLIEAIVWHPESKTLTDGRHRACALTLGGAELVPVAPGPAEVHAERTS